MTHYHNVSFYPIPTVTLNVLIKNAPTLRLENQKPLFGTLTAETSPLAKSGAFKTAHKATILLHSGQSAPIGSRLFISSDTTVVAKRPFYRDQANDKRQRYSKDEEQKLILEEATALYWASALLSYSQKWMRATDGQAAKSCPDVAFVEGAIAITEFENEPVFLLEQYVDPRFEGKWRKYIGNGSSVPIQSAIAKDQERTAFLAFIQHLQYQLTDKKVFTADFQGM